MPACLPGMQAVNAAAKCCCSQGNSFAFHLWVWIDSTEHSCKHSILLQAIDPNSNGSTPSTMLAVHLPCLQGRQQAQPGGGPQYKCCMLRMTCQ